MFIGRAQPEATSPFEGAESNLSFSTPEPFRSFERRRRGVAPRPINIVPLRGKTCCEALLLFLKFQRH